MNVLSWLCRRTPLTPITAPAIVLCFMPAVIGAGGASVTNGKLIVTVVPSGNKVTLAQRAKSVPTVTASFSAGAGKVRVAGKATHPHLGTGQAIEIEHGDGTVDRVAVYPGVPYAIFSATIPNRSAGEISLSSAARLVIEAGPAASASLRALGTAGLTAPDGHPGSYTFLALAEPASRRGVVAGWLTHWRGSGVVFSEVVAGRVHLRPRLDFGRLRIPAGGREELDLLAVGAFADTRLGLEQWADTVARVHDVHLPPQPTGYCTWYSKPYGGASDEIHLAELAEFAARELAPYGFNFVQIDDMWQIGKRRNGPAKDFTGANPAGPYPHGMKAAAHGLRALGLTGGLWFMPFAGDHQDPLFAPHPEWFVHRANGAVWETEWGGSSLDMTNPGAREHLRSVAARMARDWGFGYLKLDGLYTGAGIQQIYVNTGFRQDGIESAVFHDSMRTNVEALRSGFALVREAVGRNIFILGCNIAQNMRTLGASFGLVDAMRIGPDNGWKWKDLRSGPLSGSRLYFLNRRVWYNDPDPVYVRSSVPIEQARLITSWVALSGQLNVSTDWLPGLEPERLDILRRTMPYHNATARPVDLFEHDPARIWLVSDAARGRYVIGLFNWDEQPITVDESLARIGLPPAPEGYEAFDYWSNQPLARVTGRLRAEVPPQACRVLSLGRALGHPQVLSTSRHVTQGMIDVVEESWNAGARALSGVSRLVGGDAYELRLAWGLRATSASGVSVSADDMAAGVKASFSQRGGLVRVRIDSPATREVRWRVTFAGPHRSGGS
jgi:hypothetical protein